MIFSSAYADAAPAAQSGISAFIVPIFLILITYFLMIRPQQKRQKQHQALLASLKKGDKVMTNSGLMATIVKIPNDQEVVLEIAPGIHCKFVKSAITQQLNNQPQQVNNQTQQLTQKAAPAQQDAEQPAQQDAKQNAQQPAQQNAEQTAEQEKVDQAASQKITKESKKSESENNLDNPSGEK